MRVIVVVLIFQIFSSLSYCQSVPPEISNVSSNPSDTVAINMYRRLMNHSYDLINGKEYSIYSNINRSNPFFESATSATGTIYFNGRIYPDLHLLYDIYMDELILNYLTYDGYLKLISLNKQCVDSFLIIANDKRVMFESLFFPENAALRSGFYEVPYKGKSSLLIKHIKGTERKDGYDNYYYYIQRYIYINNQYYRIRSMSKFLRLFGDKSTLLRKYVGSLHIVSFNRITDAELVRVLKYYETL